MPNTMALSWDTCTSGSTAAILHFPTSAYTEHHTPYCHWVGPPWKHGNSLEIRFYLSTSWDTCIYVLAASIMDLSLPVSSECTNNIDDMPSELSDLENIRISIEILTIYRIQAIVLLWCTSSLAPPSWTYHFRPLSQVCLSLGYLYWDNIHQLVWNDGPTDI